MDARPQPRRLAAVVLIAVIAAGCAATATSPAPTPIPPDPDTPVVVDPPAGGDPSAGGGVPGDGATVVTPRPGQLDVRPVSAATLTAAVDGRSVVVAIDWWSGVEPCNVLDTIVVETGDHAFAITLREGHGPGDQACIEIAQLKRAFVDLGELDPGTYTISDATGGASPIEVTVA